MARPLVGSFSIKVAKAKELEIVQTIGKQDPYVVLEGPSGQKYKSKWHEDGGATPVWDQTFYVNFPASGEAKDRVVKVSVWDKNLLSDNEIGVANFSAGDLLQFVGKGGQWHALTSGKGKYAGSIFLDVGFNPGLGVKVIEGKDLKNVQTVGKQDPYVLITLGDQKVRTKEHNDGGTTPKWTDELHFFVNNPNIDQGEEKQNAFTFEVIDANVVLDKPIGIASIPFSILAKAKGQGPKWYPVFRGTKEKENVGQISLSTEVYTIPTS